MFSNQALKKLLIPLVIEQILAMLVGMTDTLMVSSAGEAAVSGVALVDMVNYLMEKFQGDTSKIWESNIFGRSFHELVNEDLQAKLQRMPEDARWKFQETLQRIVNEGSGGLICIIL